MIAEHAFLRGAELGAAWGPMLAALHPDPFFRAGAARRIAKLFFEVWADSIRVPR